MTSDLVERAQRGDHEAFDALATAAYHRLYAIARRILRDGYAAEDAVQDALVKAWREIQGLRDPAAFDAWLHRLLVNACHDNARRTRRRPIELPALPIDREEPRDDLAQLADRDELERAFLELSVEHRAVLVLTHYVGLPAPEVARSWGSRRGPSPHASITARERCARPEPRRRDAAHHPGARTMNESMDRVVAEWLHEGPENGPREGLERALAATRRVGQRPGWTFPERWLPMQLTMARTPSPRPILAIVLSRC